MITAESCRFCCGKAFAEPPSLGRSHWNVICDDCGASGPHGHDEGQAIRRWNEAATRASPTPDTPEGEVTATADQVSRANQAVLENLNADGSPKYDSAQGYACALSAIIASDALQPTLPVPQGEVAQSDRNFAADVMQYMCGKDTLWWNAIKRGERDDHGLVQLVASHRAAIEALGSDDSGMRLRTMTTQAFRTSESGDGRYAMVFKFRTLELLQQADREWQKFYASLPCDGCGNGPIIATLDGDNLCKPCADQWQRAEGEQS